MEGVLRDNYTCSGGSGYSVQYLTMLFKSKPTGHLFSLPFSFERKPHPTSIFSISTFSHLVFVYASSNLYVHKHVISVVLASLAYQITLVY